MRQVKGKDTGPEILVRRIVYGLGYRYRVHRTDLPGKPDLVFLGRRKVIFVHGCFWHGHKCKRGNRVPTNNRLYWINKINANIERDNRNINNLIKLGWSVLIVWECAINNNIDLQKHLAAFLEEDSSQQGVSTADKITSIDSY